MQRAYASSRTRRRGFTMIEMLTVIAIIAILAGILFPVFATVRRNVHKATCTSNLHNIGVALKLYKDEHNGLYPEAIYGFNVPPGNGNNQAGTNQAGTQVLGLYPQYLKSPADFRCPLSPYQLNVTTEVAGTPPSPNGFLKYPTRLYPAWDSYDGQAEPGKVGAPYIVKYTRHWSNQAPGFSDNPRQLLYKNPPDDTVVTWCTYHRDYVGGTNTPATGSLDLVLFLDGHVKPVPSNLMSPITPAVGHSYLVGEQ